jgi:hypothetical protein
MAFILLKNRQMKFVSAEQGATIWRILNGEERGTKKQMAFVKRIAKIYLNRNNAPKSYLVKHPDPEAKNKVPVGQVRLPYVD